jgi:hypothetical protein
MGAFCSTLDDDSNDLEHSRTTYYSNSPNNETFSKQSSSARKSRGPQYHGDSCDTVGMSEQLDAPTHPNPAHHYDERQQDLLESSGSLYRSAHQRRSRIRKRNQGTVKEIGRGTDGARIDLVVKDKSERKVATLTDSQVGRLLAVSGDGKSGSGGGSSSSSSSSSASSTSHTSVYDSTKDEKAEYFGERREKEVSILHDLETEIDLGRPVTGQREVKRMTDEEVAVLLRNAGGN